MLWNDVQTKVFWPAKEPWPDTRSKCLITCSLISLLVTELSRILSVQTLRVGLVSDTFVVLPSATSSEQSDLLTC